MDITAVQVMLQRRGRQTGRTNITAKIPVSQCWFAVVAFQACVSSALDCNRGFAFDPDGATLFLTPPPVFSVLQGWPKGADRKSKLWPGISHAQTDTTCPWSYTAPICKRDCPHSTCSPVVPCPPVWCFSAFPGMLAVNVCAWALPAKWAIC